jgi:hypothetical protein
VLVTTGTLTAATPLLGASGIVLQPARAEPRAMRRNFERIVESFLKKLRITF